MEISKLTDILNKLASGQPLPQKNDDHQLTGNLKDFRECHIEPDWLLMYQIHDEYMYDNKTHKVKNRIVSISQPYIRPIVRGKAKAPVEFGVKLDNYHKTRYHDPIIHRAFPPCYESQ